MSDSTSKGVDFWLQASIGFAIAAVISPLVAHIPPHLGWLSYFVGIMAVTAYGIRQAIKEARATEKSRIKISTIFSFVLGGAVGSILGVLAAHFI